MAEKIKVRTTMTPWKETVLRDQRELDQLQSLGLIYEGNATTEDGLIESAAKQVVKTRGGRVDAPAPGTPTAGNPDKAPG